jgi:hypothetical protein
LLSLHGVTHGDKEYVKIAGLTDNVKRVTRMIKFFDEYVEKLGTIEQKIQKEKAQFEAERLEF